ncbi:MAG: DUF4037 domain-containing protein [Erysipelotrichaceae bacterium]|nr:DUF4037 domain-containing protein [Erysipelotrichaceae bacterium]
MKGLELARRYYEYCGKQMLDTQFPGLREKIAVGLTGSGSQCYGFDDEISQDHDFEPGFCLFLPDESIVSESTAFQLEKAYNKLSKEFMGYKRSLLSPVGGNRVGVFRARQYFEEKIGTSDGTLSYYQWLTLPEYALLEAVNGEIFEDESDVVTTLRKRLSDYPEDIRKKKLAGYLVLMNQAGQYNYARTLERNDLGAAQLCISEFVNATIHVVYLLNNRYTPYYKWQFAGLRQLEILPVVAEFAEYLLNSGNSDEEAKIKKGMIDTIASLVADELYRQKLSDTESTDLEKQAQAVNKKITDGEIRNLNILIGV